MPKLRRLSGPDVVRILERFGFLIVSQRGSHVKLKRITETGEINRLVHQLYGLTRRRYGL
jgi:predicted RNA binding protein YcfA (HicA-like mRNA interferase family)